MPSVTMEKVLVYRAKNEIEASLVKGFLESEGLKVFSAVDATTTISDSGKAPSHFSPRGLYVPSNLEQNALRLIASRLPSSSELDTDGRFLQRWGPKFFVICIGVVLLLVIISYFV